MKLKFLMMACGLVALASACNNGESKKSSEADTSKAMAAPDTTATVAPPPAEVAPPIDSAAITREYLAARKSTKKPTAKPKKQGKSEVVMYSEPPMPTHEALEEKPPAKKDASAPAPAPMVIHTKEFVYFIPDQKASFPGGDQALTAYINKNVVYPDKALQYHIEGTVFAEVYLDSLGNVTNVEIPGTHLGGGLEEETVTVLMGLPRWHPAKENGQMVKSKVTIPVTYRIEH
jgi:periplasmic protein TonB